MTTAPSEMHKHALKLVFSNPRYLVLSILIFVGLLVSFSTLSGYIFFEPLWIFYVHDSDVFAFSLIVIIASLTGLVISMGIYRFRVLRSRAGKMTPGLLGSTIGAGAGACGCISMSIAFIPIIGAASSVIGIIETYAIPLRLISIAILVFTSFITVRGITSECKIDTKS